MNLFNMGPMEIIVILALALLVFGPRRLPEIARDLGKAISQFRQASQELTAQVSKEMAQATEVMEDVQKEVASLEQTARATLDGAVLTSPDSAAAPAVQPAPAVAPGPAEEAAVDVPPTLATPSEPAAETPQPVS